MNKEVVIIGGGVAGLSAAIRLAELGIESTVIEAGSCPAHKICGEFLSPECLHHLAHWDIHPIPINTAFLHTDKHTMQFPFSEHAGGLSHILLDPSLAARALSLGVKILTRTSVIAFHPKTDPSTTHLIHLSSGEVLEASMIIIATGRMPHLQKRELLPRYMGFKAHFDNAPSEIVPLEMFSFNGAYIGLSPVEDNKLNVACLADLKAVGDTDPLLFIERLISRHPKLNALLSNRTNLFDHWMIAPLPSFGLKDTPNWPDAYFIGDAAATVPPACGNGLSLAITGGCLAAEYLSKREASAFKSIWAKRCSKQLFWANLIHKLMMNPSLGNGFLFVSRLFPFMQNKLFDLSRSKR